MSIPTVPMYTVRALALLCCLHALACSKDETQKVVAISNGRPITAAQVDAFFALKRIPKDDAARRDAVLTEYLEREALADAIAQEPGLDKATLQAELREHEKELLISRYFEKLLDEKVDEAAIRAYYAANTDKYSERRIHVAHILLRTSPRSSDEERQAKLTAAHEAYARLKKGESFSAVAAALSEDKISATKGGDLGSLREGSVDPRFSQKVFAMQKDEVSEPFETAFGYHVVKVLEAPQTVTRAYEAVQGDIRYQLRAEAKKAESERLQSKIKIERKAGSAPAPAKSDDSKQGSAVATETAQATAEAR